MNVTTNVTLSSEERWKFLLYMIASGCVALILILLFITVCYVYKKKQQKSTTESLPAAEEEYATVRPQTKRKKKKEEEEEVQYGEVTFTPNHSVAPQQHQEECVYAQVQSR
ncbi:hypothetical protein cypCar_00042491 [Cyprinus carpio]|nr:hypothetical protein cypCar_00042491 [Cyprinus carpio]